MSLQRRLSLIPEPPKARWARIGVETPTLGVPILYQKVRIWKQDQFRRIRFQLRSETEVETHMRGIQSDIRAVRG